MRAPLPLAALAAAAACGAFRAEVDDPSLCLTAEAVPFPGGASGTAAQSVPLRLDLPLLHRAGASTSVHLDRVELSPVGGGRELAGLETVRIRILPPPGSGLPVREVVSWSRDPAHPPGASFAAAGPADLDLAPYLVVSGSRLEAVLSGSLPTSPWIASVTTCLAFHASVPLGP